MIAEDDGSKALQATRSDPEADRELVQRLIQGSQEAWNEFLDRYTRLLYKVFCTRSFGFTREDTEELVNDFLLSIMEDGYRKIRLFEGRNQCSFGSYLKKIAINMAIDRRKKAIRRQMISLHRSLDGSREDEGRDILHVLDSGMEVPEQSLMNGEEAEQYRQALYQLPPSRLIVVLLIVYHSLDREEMAKLLKTTRQNIDVIFNRSKEQLKKLLNPPKEKRQKTVPLLTSWNDKIRSCMEQMLLEDRYALLDRCIEKLTIPKELVIGLVFIDSLALDPRPERLSLFLKKDSAITQSIVEKTLKKVIHCRSGSRASSDKRK